MDLSIENTTFSSEHLILTIPSMAVFDIDSIKQEDLLKKCNDFYIKNNLNLRIYKTKNGYRAFITNVKFGFSNDKQTLIKYCKEISADTRYLNMMSETYSTDFSTRISPKYLNIRVFPTSLDSFFKKYQQYKQKNEAITSYITSIGNGEILQDFKNFIEQHDQETKAFNKNSILV
jgi:hypothetical protein